MKDHFKQFSELSSNLSDFAKRELSSVQDAVDKTLNSALEMGKSGKEAIISGVDKSVDLIQSAGDTELAKSIVDTAKNVVSTTSDQASKYVDQLAEVTANKMPLEPQDKADNSAYDLSHVIEKLQGKDKVGVLGETLAAAGGGAAGVAAASTLASAAGVSTLLGSTSLAGALGGVFVTATPVGWVIGAAVAAGAAGYGIAKLVRSGSKQDQVREELIKRLESRLAVLKKAESIDSSLEELHLLLPVAIERELISDVQAERMVGLIESGALKVEIALQRIKLMM